MFSANRKLLSLAVALALVVALMGGGALAAPSSAIEMVDVLIGFHGSVQPDVLTQLGAEVNITYKYMPVVAARLPAQAITALSRNPVISFIEPDAEVTICAQSIPWGVNRIQAPLVHSEKGIRGDGVKVAILDTGIDPNHLDLNVVGGTSFISGTTWADDHGHGTHVAGTVAALDNTRDVLGVAPNVALYAVKVLDSQGSGTFSGIANGIEWCITNNMQVINMSLGGSSGSSALELACQNAWNAGIVIVAAAGNSGNSGGTGDNIGYPAKYSTVIAVGSTTSSDLRSYFSSTGPALEIMAPGSDIPSTKRGGGTTTMSGTSMASPHVAGVAALILAAAPGWTNQQVRDRMNETAEAIGDGDPYKYGNGLVNAYLAVPGEADPSQISATIATDKSQYIVGETIVITVTARDGLGAVLPGATADLTITTAGSQVFTDSGTTNSSGQAVFTFLTAEAHGFGQWTFATTVSKTEYNPGTASTTCEVKSGQEPELVMARVWTNKSTYGWWQFAYMYAEVRNTDNDPVQGASVQFTVVCPLGTVTTRNATTNTSGIASASMLLWWIHFPGTYTVTAVATHANYPNQVSGSTTFLLL